MSTLAEQYDNPHLRAALSCVEAGYPVIPLHPRAKERRTRAGTALTTDSKQVRS